MEKVNVIVGRFQPFTLGHIKGAQEVMNKYNLRTVFLVVNTPKEKTDVRHPFPSDIIIKDNERCGEKWMAGMYPIQNADIGKIMNICREHDFEPVMWTCGTDRVKAYSYQVQDKYIKMYNITPDFKINEIPRSDEDISATAVRNYIKNDDLSGYKKMMPQWTWNCFDKYRDILLSIKESKCVKSLSDYLKELL